MSSRNAFGFFAGCPADECRRCFAGQGSFVDLRHNNIKRQTGTAEQPGAARRPAGKNNF
jgi:hypothetical protein